MEKSDVKEITKKEFKEKTITQKRCDGCSSDIKPPLGLIPKKLHDERVKIERFNEVCGAISRYYNAGMKIKIEWIEEYNEYIEKL